MKLINPICLALDVDQPAEAMTIAQELRGQIGVIKVGPRLTNVNSEIVSDLAMLGPVFVDHKYFDIPSTMDAAVRSAFESGASFVTIHAAAGKTALKTLAKIEQELNKKRPFRLLAVTVLTSFTSEDFPPFSQSISIEKQVNELAKLSFESGIDGIVCSPHEIESVRKVNSNAFIVTPGIRSKSDVASNRGGDDQNRTLSASEALRKGANLLVIGRPIVKATDRRVALENILSDISKDSR